MDSSYPQLSHIREIARVLWTRTQLTLNAAGHGFDVLRQAAIPFIVFKGGAFLAESHAIAAKRMIGDVDLLVSPDAAELAIDRLTGAGWLAANGESPAYLRRLARIRISGNYCRGEHGKVDLHITPFHFAREDRELDRLLWQDARNVSLSNQALLIPDPADSVVLSLAHAPISNSVEWAIDVAARIADGTVDWEKVVHIVRRRELVPSGLAGLRFLSERIYVAVPERVVAELNRTPVRFSSWIKYWSNLCDRSDRNVAEKAANRIADRILSARSHTRFVKDAIAVTVVRPTVAARYLQFRNELPQGQSLPFAKKHFFHALPTREGSKLVMVLAIRTRPKSRRVFFDVVANGEAIARLRCRLRPSRRPERLYAFSIPLPSKQATAIEVSIEARPTLFLPESASRAARLEFDPVDFRLARAAVAR
jgi:hypothetical protein